MTPSRAVQEPRHTEGQGEVCDPSCPHWEWAKDRAAQEKPTSPRTEAGHHEYSATAIADALLDRPITLRAGLVHSLLSFAMAGPTNEASRNARDRLIRDTRAAIEREAAAATPSLDAKRLRKAMQKHLADPWHGYLGDEEVIACTADEYSECPDEIAAEYARLDEGSATPDPEG